MIHGQGTYRLSAQAPELAEAGGRAVISADLGPKETAGRSTGFSEFLDYRVERCLDVR